MIEKTIIVKGGGQKVMLFSYWPSKKVIKILISNKYNTILSLMIKVQCK